MLFNSLAFLVFAPCFLVGYFALAGRTRLYFTLICSYFFYAWWDWRFVTLLIASSLIGYAVGLGIERAAGNLRRQRRLVGVSLVFNIGLLLAFKYLNFFLALAWSLVGLAVPVPSTPQVALILPVGISFFTFQNLSYVIDVYRGTIPRAERDFLKFASYTALFPHLVAGPIVRAAHLLPQLGRDHPLDWRRIGQGLEWVIWGFFLKLCLADTAATIVNPRFAAPEYHGGLAHGISVLCFSLQIYGDFSGYSLIAIGLGKMMGFDFGVNFKRPYFATSFSDFWARWHISLSSWLRDYVYIPLGGNRQGTFLTRRNLFLTMLIGGLWHGAGYTFLIWGALHGVFLVGQRLLTPLLAPLSAYLPKLAVRIIGVATVFSLTSFAWIFFRADSLNSALTIIRIIATSKDMSFSSIGIVKVAVAALVVFGVDALSTRERIRLAYEQRPFLRITAAASLVLLILLLGTFEGASFLYFQF